MPRYKVEWGRPEPLASARTKMSRRSLLASGPIALAAASALAACSAAPESGAVSAPVLRADTELGNLSDGAPDLVV
ncbi:MAG: hypothetical protein JWR00_1055, partial [Rubritepida sp.]|nr:hypothetical protein [Rubritepida sp.]